MQKFIALISLTVSTAALVAGCGGGTSSAAASTSTTTPVTTTVVDGAILNAVVCLDKNGNGQCDAGEVQGKTDALGNVTLAVPNADVGKYPVIAVVGTDAVDAENGPVTAAYTMAAPADQSGVVSPLTTLVQQTVASTGVSTADAAKTVQDAMGVSVSLFADFTKVAAPTDGSLSAKTLARLIVVTTQAQSTALASAVGTAAIDGATITKTDLDKVVQQKLIELLPTLVSAMSNADVLAATTHTAKETALAAAAANAVTNVSGLTAASLTTLVAVNNAPAAPVVVKVPTASVGVASLSFTNAMSYTLHLLTASVAQNTPDANGNTRYISRSTSATGGNVTQWGAGNDPTRNADLHWNGSHWTNCPLNFENTAAARDATGSSAYNYCDSAQTGKSKGVRFDIGGKPMASVYAQIRAAGYTDLSITDPTMLANATFPSGAAMTYFNSSLRTTAIGYYPGSNSRIKQYDAGVSSACGATAMSTSSVTTLEGLIRSRAGTPCVFTSADSFVYTGTVYSSGLPNASYAGGTLNLGRIGTVALNTGRTAPGYFSGNTRINVAFTGTGRNAVTYLACQERFTDGAPRNCTTIGTGSYTIATLDDGRILTLNNLPVQAADFPSTRVFVERGGFVYWGYQNRLTVNNSARLNTVGGQALLTQLGLGVVNPEVPFTLTAGSYQGSWDFHDTPYTVDGNGTNITISANGTVVCTAMPSGSTIGCTLSLTNASTGAFTATTTDGLSATGSLNFMTGTGSGTWHNASSTPADGSFVVQRR